MVFGAISWDRDCFSFEIKLTRTQNPQVSFTPIPHLRHTYKTPNDATEASPQDQRLAVDGGGISPLTASSHQPHVSPCSLHGAFREAQLCHFWLPSGTDSYKQTITGVSKHVATAGCMISC